ncbi:threonylcarbamoyl-AMP synthase [bacterium]|nr:threonylcarbamoyl-AMP synthase [bacterium]
MQRALVGVVIGSRADFNVMRRGLETLRVMGVPYVFEVIAPHRGPERLADFARGAGEKGIEVLIAAGGGSSLIANHIASYTNLPVIGVPIDASPLRGQDALYSMVQTPPGVPVATVGINNSENAAILAAQILALKYPQFRMVLAHRRMASVQRLDAIQKELRSEYPDLCLPDRTAPVKNAALSGSDSDTDSEGDGSASSEAVTPEPPEDSVRIRPGAVFVERPTGVGAQDLVSTPIPQEPGTGRREARPVSIQQLLGDKRPPAVASSVHDLDTKEDSDSSDAETETPTPLLPPAEHVPIPVASDEAPPEPEPVEEAPEERHVETKIFKINRNEPDVDILEHAMMVLLEGGVLALPTDTVYGLAADATNKDALELLFALKGQERQRTLGVLIHHPDMLERLVREIPPALEPVLEACWPGALTVILPKAPGVLTGVSASDRVGIRVPNDRVCLEVISRVGRPVAMRNATVANSEPMTSAEPVVENFNGLVDCVLDGGECAASAGASTVLSVMGDRFEILREGGISRATLRDLLGDKLKD